MSADTPALAEGFLHVCVGADHKPTVLRQLAIQSSLEALSSQAVSFCFPEYIAGQEQSIRKLPISELSSETQVYVFALTSQSGSRTYGVCLRFANQGPNGLSPAAGGGGWLDMPSFSMSSAWDPFSTDRAVYPQVYCILTPLPWFAFFTVLLRQILAMGYDDLPHEGSKIPEESPVAILLRQVCQRALPPPNSVLKIPIPANARHPEWAQVVLRVPSEGPALAPEGLPAAWAGTPPHRELSFGALLRRVPLSTTVALLAALLYERRVVISSASPPALTAAVLAANAMLYPLGWQHIFLPVLPHPFIDYLTAPMPFLVGLPAALMGAMRAVPTEEVVFVDLDSGDCEHFSRDVASIPPGPLKLLREELQQVLDRPFHDHAADRAASDAFVGFFARLLGSYRRHVVPEADFTGQPSSSGGGPGGASEPDAPLAAAGLVLDHAAWEESYSPSSHMRAFLRSCRATQMYEVFIRERLTRMAGAGPAGVDAFEERLADPGVQASKDSLRNSLSSLWTNMNSVTPFPSAAARQESSTSSAPTTPSAHGAAASPFAPDEARAAALSRPGPQGGAGRDEAARGPNVKGFATKLSSAMKGSASKLASKSASGSTKLVTKFNTQVDKYASKLKQKYGVSAGPGAGPGAEDFSRAASLQRLGPGAEEEEEEGGPELRRSATDIADLRLREFDADDDDDEGAEDGDPFRSLGGGPKIRIRISDGGSPSETATSAPAVPMLQPPPGSTRPSSQSAGIRLAPPPNTLAGPAPAQRAAPAPTPVMDAFADFSVFEQQAVASESAGKAGPVSGPVNPGDMLAAVLGQSSNAVDSADGSAPAPLVDLLS